MTERVFVQQLDRSGFIDIAAVERETYGVDHLAAEPLFPDDLIDLMRRLMPQHVQERIGVRVTLAARKPPGMQ